MLVVISIEHRRFLFNRFCSHFVDGVETLWSIVLELRRNFVFENKMKNQKKEKIFCFD